MKKMPPFLHVKGKKNEESPKHEATESAKMEQKEDAVQVKKTRKSPGNKAVVSS